MMTFSRDAREAEKQVHAIIYYLITFGYIDGDFDLSEKEFIKEYIKQIVDQKLKQGGGYEELPAKALAALRAEQEEHYILTFEQLDESIQELFSEVVDRKESVQDFIRFKLKLRCYEIFRSFNLENRNALMEVIDEFIMADGVSHPAEVEFRNELADLLNLEPMLNMDELEVVATTLEIGAEEPRPAAMENHPFMKALEVHYAADPTERQRQAQYEMDLLGRVTAQLAQMRQAGAGRLADQRSFEAVLAEGDWFLDGYVFGIPPKPGRRYDLTVLGDLHGCYSCLKAALLQADFFAKVDAFKADPEGAPYPMVILLGDYIDRGKFSYNGTLRAVLELFLQYPGHVFPLRGNHEYYIEYEGTIYGGVLPAEAINVHRDYFDKEFFLTYMRFFEELPTVAVFDRLFFVHAGIPKDSSLAGRQDLTFLNDPEIRFQMLWSDPSEADIIPKSLQEESARFPFGTLQFANFMGTIGCNVLVRGHTKINEGFKTVVDDGNNKLLNLFSAGGKYNEDLPSSSTYRQVTPKALTILYQDGEVTATPWVIDYEAFNSPIYNRFFSAQPAINYDEVPA
jgi:uncharacterized tellurite resistance protein B-like protein